MKRNILDRDQTCPDGMVFTEDESYLLCRYEEKDRKLYDKIWEETFGQSPVLNDTELKIKLWQDVLFDKNKLQLKIIHKKTGNYVGEVMVMNLDSEMPELGIQILKEYQGKGIGSRIMKNFIDQLKSILPVEAFLVKISSDNHICRKLFENMGAVQIGEEGKEYGELFKKAMEDMGKEVFEKSVTSDVGIFQRYIICYKIEARGGNGRQ